MSATVAEALDGEYEVRTETNAENHSVVYGDSVTGDTLVYTKQGQVPIRELFKTVDTVVGTKEYYHPTVEVLTYDEQKNKTCFKQVKYVMRHKCEKQIYNVALTNYQSINVTEDHSLIGYKNTRAKKKDESHLTEIKPQELGGDIKSVVYLQSLPYDTQGPRYNSIAVYEMMGLVVGDGHAGKINEGICLSVGSKDIPELEIFLNKLVELGLSTSWFVMKHNGHDIRICGTDIFKKVKESLYETNTKDIPNWLLNEPPECIAAFLRGYFTADGTVTGKKVVLCTIKERFALMVQQLLFRCRISSTITKETTENSYKGKKSGTFTYRVIIKQSDIFKELIGFLLPRKQSRIPEVGRLLKYQSQFDFATSSVSHVTPIQYNDYVYDIEVEDTHTFFANNILVHNTDSVYFKTHTDNVDDAIKIGDAVCEKINKSFSKLLKERFCCTDEFTDKLAAGREIVSDRGIFIDKKRYILHIADDEGKRVDKLKVMGVELKKTTLPREIQAKLKEYIERLLKGEEWGLIGKDIIEYKKELLTTDDFMLLGLPKGVHNVEQYVDEYERDHRTNLPGHVAASLLWNMQRESHEDFDTPQIMSGSKIKVFYLRKIFAGRFKSIAVPVDIDEIPQWFIDKFVPIIDRDAQLERLINKPLMNIIKAINEKVPDYDNQSLIADEFFDF